MATRKAKRKSSKRHVKEEEQRGGMFAEAKQSDMELVALGQQLAVLRKELMAAEG